MEKLAGQRRIHYRGLLPDLSTSFRRQFDGLEIVPAMANNSGNTTVNNDRCLHRLPVRPGEGTRHVAKPLIAAALVGPGNAARGSRSYTGRCLVSRNANVRRNN